MTRAAVPVRFVDRATQAMVDKGSLRSDVVLLGSGRRAGKFWVEVGGLVDGLDAKVRITTSG